MPQINPQTICLTEKEGKNPMKFLHQFFQNHHLTEIHKLMWEWLVCGLTQKDGYFEDPKQRSKLIWCYQEFEKLFEAAWLIQNNHYKSKIEIQGTRN
jgi:hypothetical protein